MPYLDSNQDVRNNELYNKAIMGAAIIVGGAALGQSMGKNIGKFLDNWGAPKNGKDVLKGLYGDAAGKFGKEISDGITMAERSADGPQHKVVDKLLGGKKVKRTDGNFLSRMADNYNNAEGKWYNKVVGSFKDNDVTAFNKQLKDAYQGRRYSDSKLSIYEDLLDGAKGNGINIDSKQGMELANNAYNSKASIKNRSSAGIKNLVDDAELTSSIWDTSSNNKTYKDKANAKIEEQFQKDLKTDPVARGRLDFAKGAAELNRKDVVTQLQYQGEQERKANTKKAFNKLNNTERNIKYKKARQEQSAADAKAQREFLGSYADNKHKTSPSSFFGKSESTTTSKPTNEGLLDSYADSKHTTNPNSFFGRNDTPDVVTKGTSTNPHGSLKGSWSNAKKFSNFKERSIGLNHDFQSN